MRFKNIYKLFFVALILFLILFFVNSNIKAANNEWLEDPLGVTNPNTGITDIGQGIKIIVDAIITIAQVAFIVLFLIGGVMYLTSMGNEDQAKKARALLLEAVIGIVIVTAAWAVSTWIISRLKGGGAGASNNPINNTSPSPNSTAGVNASASPKAIKPRMTGEASFIDSGGNMVFPISFTQCTSSKGELYTTYIKQLKGESKATQENWRNDLTNKECFLNSSGNCRTLLAKNTLDQSLNILYNLWSVEAFICYDDNGGKYVSNGLSYQIIKDGKIVTGAPVINAAPTLEEMGLK